MSSPSALKNSPAAATPPGSQRFPASRRLRKRAEFQRVYEQGTRFAGSLFVVFCRRGETNDPARVGLTVPRAIGNAVKRNRAKRRLREAARRHWMLLPAGLEMVVHARGRIAEADWPTLETEVVRAFKKAARLTDVSKRAREGFRRA